MLFSAVPGQLHLAIAERTATSVSSFWSFPSGSVVTSYEVMWQRDTTGECSDEDEDSDTITDTSYDITGLEEDSSYSITVRASNAAGSSEDSNTVTAMTREAGENSCNSRACFCHNDYALAPSEAPIHVRKLEETSSSITVQWEPVKCIHRNGDITHYNVRYKKEGSAHASTISLSREMTITGLDMYSNYTIEVAAVNNAGIGIYSVPFNACTDGELHHANKHTNIQVCLTFLDS